MSTLNRAMVEQSPLFTRWQDPVTGVESFLLSQRVAPVQMGFYFTNASFTSDGRYLWLYCIFPPVQGNACCSLAVVDFITGQIHHYPETQFLDASPFVDKDTGDIYWTSGLEVWKRGPLPEDRPVLINSFPLELANGRWPRRTATHLTLSADKKAFSIDTQVGTDWYIGDLPLDGSPFRLWQKFDRGYNHIQFSPTDPDLLLIAQDSWNDPTTGNYGPVVDRLWLLRRGEKAYPIYPDNPSNMRGHEWWDADGEHVWYIDYRKGTEKVNIHTRERTVVWANGHTHSQCDQKSQYLVGDIAENCEDWRLAFYNINTGKEIGIVSKFPVYQSIYPTRGSWSLSALTPGYNRANYHVHPHPHFCQQDRYICYTTNVRGSVDLALVSVEQLVALTSP